MGGEYRALQEAYRRETDQAQQAAIKERLDEKRKQAEPLTQELVELSRMLQKAEPLRNAGHVFLFLRQP